MFKGFGRKNRLLMLANFLFALSHGLWFNLRQIHLADLGAMPQQIGVALALSTVAAGIVPVPAGYITDRMGPQRVIVVSWVLGVAGTAFMALATTWQAVTLGLAVFMLCSAANPALVAYVMLNLPEYGRGNSERTLTTVLGSYPAAMVFAPALGGLIADRAGIRAAMWVGAGVLALAVVVILVAGRAKPGEPSEQARVSGLLRNRAFVVISAYFTLTMVALYAGFMLAPNYLEDVRGFSPAVIGVLFSMLSVGTVVFNIVAGRVNPRRGFALLLAAPWLALIGLWKTGAVVVTGLAFFLLGAISTTWALVMAAVGRVVDEQHQGLAFGVWESLISLAVAAASWVAGGLYDLSPGHELPLIVGVVSVPLMLALWILTPLGSIATPERRTGSGN